MGTRIPDQSTGGFPPIVLVVDGHEDTLEMYDVVLGTSGFRVISASNALEALASVQVLRPDVVVTDLGLPGRLSGPGLIRALQADPALADIPILCVTGRDPRDVRSMIGVQVPSLLKPVTPEALVRHVMAAAVLARQRHPCAAPARKPVPGLPAPSVREEPGPYVVPAAP
jgi:CheY-like chemotaxis protein